MSEAPPWRRHLSFKQMSEGMRGPFGLDVLMQLVGGGAISPGNPSLQNSEIGPWIPLGRHDVAGELVSAQTAFCPESPRKFTV